MDSKDVAQPFLNTYLFNISDYLAIIPTLIILIRSRTINKEMVESNQKIELIYNQGDAKSANFKWFIILVGLFDFGSHISSLMFYIVYGKNDRSISENNLSSLLIFNTITIYLLSRLILKTYFYKHHYFSFLINIICILILGTIDIINIINSEDKGTTGMVIFYILKKILTIIFYSVEDVIGKKVLMEEFINIYSLLTYRAICVTVFLVLFSLPFIFVEVTDKSGKTEETGIIFGRIMNLFDKLNFFKIIMFILTNFFYNIFIWSIIDKFSPSHYAISNILESFGTLIRLWIVEPETVNLPVLRMFIFFILIFGSFIHTEMIVINYWDLQKNTKLFLSIKEKEDMKLINEEESSGNNLRMSIVDQHVENNENNNEVNHDEIDDDNQENN